MINYQADVCTDRYIVSIEGHAGYAPKGSDIVCAASSALAFALLEAVKRMDEGGEVSNLFHSVTNGSFQIDFTVKDFAGEKAEAIVDTITDAFLMLEEHYPEYVMVS